MSYKALTVKYQRVRLIRDLLSSTKGYVLEGTYCQVPKGMSYKALTVKYQRVRLIRDLLSGTKGYVL